MSAPDVFVSPMKKTKLQPAAFVPVSPASVQPTGWLRRQLEIQANGLGGHLHEFWPDIKDSGWIGGKAEGWERVPYWLDGFIPLAYLLNDAKLKEVADFYMNHIIQNQAEDGWIGTKPAKIGEQDMWSHQLMAKVLLQYHLFTGKPEARNALDRLLRRMRIHIKEHALRGWGKSRWFEGLIAVYWLYEQTGEAWLMQLARDLKAQGEDWGALSENWPERYRAQIPNWEATHQTTHIVNNAMAVKAAGLVWRLTGDARDRARVHRLMNVQDTYHGRIFGVPAGDEHIAGLRAVQGTELCAVVEYMFSLETLISIMGDPAFGDRLELIAFNALPATFLPDMWAHQYLQQVNQVMCAIREDRPWTTNAPDSTIFGLEPNYGCCTANMHQGWPKFATSLWMKQGKDTLAAVAYAPNTLSTEVDGAAVTIDLATDYPFKDKLNFTVTVAGPTKFKLMLRIPAWSCGATVEVDGKTYHAQAGTYHVVNRKWTGSESVTLTLPMQPRLHRQPERALAISRGPLIYSLPIGEERRRVNETLPGRELPHGDWELHPTTPWNYGLDLLDLDLSNMVFTERELGDCPFSPEQAPVSCEVKATRIPKWEFETGGTLKRPHHYYNQPGEKQLIKLIPYGCTNLRLTEFPEF